MSSRSLQLSAGFLLLATGCSLFLGLDGPNNTGGDTAIGTQDGGIDAHDAGVELDTGAAGDGSSMLADGGRAMGCPAPVIGTFCEDFNDPSGRVKLVVDSTGSGNTLKAVQDAGMAYSPPGYLTVIAADAGNYRVTVYQPVKVGVQGAKFEVKMRLKAVKMPGTLRIFMLSFNGSNVELTLGGTNLRLKGDAYRKDVDGGFVLDAYGFSALALPAYDAWYDVGLMVDLLRDELYLSLDSQTAGPYSLSSLSKPLSFNRTTSDPSLILGPGNMNATPYMEYHVDDMLFRMVP